MRETVKNIHSGHHITSEMPVTLYYSGNEACAPGHSFGPAVRPHYLIHFILRGKGQYLRKGITYALKKGDAFLIFPGETTSYCADQADPWEYDWIAFDGPDAWPVLKRCGFTQTDCIHRSADDVAAEHLIEHIRNFESCFLSCGPNMLEALGRFYLVFACMFRESVQDISEPAEENVQKLYFMRAVKYLEHNFSYPVKITQAARTVGISRTYLYRLFEAHSGMSPQQYLMNLRLEASCAMLSHTQKSVTEIAYSCGFGDSPSFCRYFKNAYGMTPRQYRCKID